MYLRTTQGWIQGGGECKANSPSPSHYFSVHGHDQRDYPARCYSVLTRVEPHPSLSPHMPIAPLPRVWRPDWLWIGVTEETRTLEFSKGSVAANNIRQYFISSRYATACLAVSVPFGRVYWYFSLCTVQFKMRSMCLEVALEPVQMPRKVQKELPERESESSSSSSCSELDSKTREFHP